MKKNIIINFDLNYDDDKEIFEHLQKKRNKTAFIKNLIIEDIKYGNNKIEHLVKKAQLSNKDIPVDEGISHNLSGIDDNEDLFESSNDLFSTPEEPEEREERSDSSMNFLKSLGSFEDDDE